MIWPRWKRATVVVVATGPSAKGVLLTITRGRAKVIVVNGSFRLVPWADVLYATDRSWWESNRGVPQFHGLKVSASPRAAAMYPEIAVVQLRTGARIVMEPGTVGSGSRDGNGGSGFHAINLAAQFGAARIVLIGFDRASPQLDGCAGQFRELDIDVVNAFADSELTAYPKMSLFDAIGIGWPSASV